MRRYLESITAFGIGLAWLLGDAETSPAQDNTVTAIDIALEPDATMVQHARADNARLLKDFPEGFALDATHHPHITMLQQFVRTADLDKVYSGAKEVLITENVALYRDKYELGGQFFSVVGGNPYRSPNERVIIVDNLITELLDKHNGWDNFHHEAPVAANLWSYVPDQNSIFENLAARLFKTVLLCRIGRGVAYNNGVSPGGKRYYDAILSLTGDKYAPHVMASFAQFEVQGQLGRAICRTQAKHALETARSNAINPRLIECLTYLVDHIEANPKCPMSPEFKRLSGDYIRWS